MNRKQASDYDQKLLDLYDAYAHGRIGRRDFLHSAAHLLGLAHEVSQIGEFGLIDLLSKTVGGAEDKWFESRQQLIAGIGDDAAAWQGDTSVQLATVDSLIQDVHFSLATTSWADLGLKAMAANLSDQDIEDLAAWYASQKGLRDLKIN